MLDHEVFTIGGLKVKRTHRHGYGDVTKKPYSAICYFIEGVSIGDAKDFRELVKGLAELEPEPGQ